MRTATPRVTLRVIMMIHITCRVQRLSAMRSKVNANDVLDHAHAMMENVPARFMFSSSQSPSAQLIRQPCFPKSKATLAELKQARRTRQALLIGKSLKLQSDGVKVNPPMMPEASSHPPRVLDHGTICTKISGLSQRPRRSPSSRRRR